MDRIACMENFFNAEMSIASEGVLHSRLIRRFPIYILFGDGLPPGKGFLHQYFNTAYGGTTRASILSACRSPFSRLHLWYAKNAVRCLRNLIALFKFFSLGGEDKIKVVTFLSWSAKIFTCPSWPILILTSNGATWFLDWICSKHCKSHDKSLKAGQLREDIHTSGGFSILVSQNSSPLSWPILYFRRSDLFMDWICPKHTKKV